MKTYIERMSIAVENDVLRDRCKNNIRIAREALGILTGNRYFKKGEIERLRSCLNKIINN